MCPTNVTPANRDFVHAAKPGMRLEHARSLECQMTSRDDFSPRVKRVLADRAGHRCSNPGCRSVTSGPQAAPDGAVNIGVAAHIAAAAKRGPRYDPRMTPQERSSIENAIWLCQNCAKLIDNDPERFTAGLLLRWKVRAEARALRNLGNARSADGSTPLPRLLAEYLRALQGYCKSFPYLSLHGLAATRSLERVYVPPELRRDQDAHARHVGHSGIRQKRDEFLASEYLKQDEHRHSFLWGGAGAGKSTVLRNFASLCWSDFTSIGLTRQHIPLLVPLRKFALVAGSIEERLNHVLCSDLVLPQPLPSYFLRDWPARTGAPWLFLLDGLDEVHPRSLPEILRFIQVLASEFVTSTIIVSSRQMSSITKATRQLDFTEFAILPFTAPQVQVFAGKWFPESGGEFVREVNGIRNGELRGTPLLLTIAAMVYQEVGSLPRNRAKLYSEAVRIWLDEAEFQGLNAELDGKIRKLSHHVLVRLARYLSEHDETMFGALVGKVAQVLRHALGSSTIEAEADAEIMVRVLGRRSGFFVEREGTYEFFHPTFREYLTAVSFLEDSGDDIEVLWQEILSRTLQHKWREVALFVFSLLSTKNVDVSNAVMRLLPASPGMVRRAFHSALEDRWNPVTRMLDSVRTLTSIVADGGVVTLPTQRRIAKLILLLLEENEWLEFPPIDAVDGERLISAIAVLDAPVSLPLLRWLTREDYLSDHVRFAASREIVLKYRLDHDINTLYAWARGAQGTHQHSLVADIADVLLDVGRKVECNVLADRLTGSLDQDAREYGVALLATLAEKQWITSGSLEQLVTLYGTQVPSERSRTHIQDILAISTLPAELNSKLREMVEDEAVDDWLRCDTALLLAKTESHEVAADLLAKLAVVLPDSYARAYAERMAKEVNRTTHPVV